MQDRKEFEKCAKKLAAFTDVSRLRMVQALFAAGEMTVSALASVANIHITMASHHLSVLLDAGIVSSRRQGRFVYFSLAPDVIVTRNGRTCEAIKLGCCVIDFGQAQAVSAAGADEARPD